MGSFLTKNNGIYENLDTNGNVLEVSAVSAPEYCFDEFVARCEKLQAEKVKVQNRIRLQLQKWRLSKENKSESLHEEKHQIFLLVHLFRTLNEEQNILIQKEKVRFDMMSQTIDEKDIKRMRNRLKYFILLNKEHEELSLKVREDTIGCKWDKRIVGGSKTRQCTDEVKI